MTTLLPSDDTVSAAFLFAQKSLKKDGTPAAVQPQAACAGRPRGTACRHLKALVLVVVRTHATEARPVETADMVIPADKWALAYQIPVVG